MPRPAHYHIILGERSINLIFENGEQDYATILDTFAEHLERGTKKTFVGGKEAHDLDFKVSVTPFEKEDSNIRGLARIFIEDRFVIGNVSLLEGKNGLFVAMPSYKTKQTDKDGKSVYQDYSDSLIIPIF